MKDILLSKTNYNYFDDIVFEKDETGKVVFKTVENEQKLSQTLTKLFLTDQEEHIFGLGLNRAEISYEEIERILELYKTIILTDNPKEKISFYVINQKDITEFEIIIRTEEGTTLSFVIGA